MEDGEKAALVAKAKRLEEKQLYVKAAEIYASIGMGQEAAGAFEAAGSLGRAIALYEKLGKADDAARCRKKRDEASSGQTWQDLQAEFQKDRGNPY